MAMMLSRALRLEAHRPETLSSYEDPEDSCSEQVLLEGASTTTRYRHRRFRGATTTISLALLGVALACLVVVRGGGRHESVADLQAAAQKAESKTELEKILETIGDVSHIFESGWNKTEGIFEEGWEDTESGRNRLKKHFYNIKGSLVNRTEQMDRHMLNQQLQHAMEQGWDTVHDLRKKTKEWKNDIRSIMNPIEFLNGTIKSSCEELDGLYIEKVLHSNLGGQGPDGGEESLIFASNRTEDGVTVKQLAFKVTANSPYVAGWNQMNGLSHGLVGKYGQITLKPGSSVNLTIRTYDLETGELLHMPTAAFTFFDLDEGAGHKESEYITVSDFAEVEYTPETEVIQRGNPDGSTTFQASTEGNFEDNPIDPLLLTSQQKNRAVTVTYKDVEAINIVLGATAGAPGAWRCFIFVGHPVLKCAKTLDTRKESDEELVLPRQKVLIAAIGVLILIIVLLVCCWLFCL